MSAIKKGKEASEHNYKINDIVLAKIRGYPAWPGQIMDPDKVPAAVAKERQTGKKLKFYCVRFFPAGDYSWVVAKDLSLLQKHEIEAYINEPHKKSGDLLQGYKIALDPSEWEAKMAQRLQQKAEEEADEDVDQLDEGDDDEDVDDEPKKKSRKRKRESDAKPKKKEGTKSASGPTTKEKKAAPAKKRSKKGGLSKENVESEDEAGETANGDAVLDSSKKAGPPPAKKAKKDKGDEEFAHMANDPEALKVKDWRNKLQRAFLSKSIPKPEDMPEYNQLMTIIEQHELTIEQLQFSKLGKVMRHISNLTQPIPNEDQFKIKERAEKLLEKWSSLIQAANEANGVPDAKLGRVDEDEPEEASNQRGPAVAEEKPAVNGDTAGITEAKAASKVEESFKAEDPAAAPDNQVPAAASEVMDTAA